MADYVAKGYVRKLTKEDLQQPHKRVWYLPVFPVRNPNKPSKLRLVWDAAATSHGISLNDLLLKGPDQLASLLSILIHFREFKVAVCGDIREMYLQVLVMEGDQQCLRFLWKDLDEDEEVSVYILLVMPFGVCCSPSIAQYVKNTNAKRFEQDYPNAVHAIINKHYVDDMLVSVETEEEAIILAKNVKRIHKAGGFEMRNWLSNSPKVVTALHETDTTEKNLSIGNEVTTEKVLGMWWDTAKDCFTYKLSSRFDTSLLSGSKRPTKREVLRLLMMIFDPIGLISHFLMYLKVLLQDIWRSSIGWDDEILEPEYLKWSEWLEVLPNVTTLRIPRCYRMSISIDENNEVQLHTFVDASENVFAAVVYLRFHEGSTIECALVGAKTRVAPLRFLSIPRSELQAAVIGTRLAHNVMQALSMKTMKRFFWCDSKDVLWWLNSDHRRYSQFVAVRVSEILELTNVDEWQYVPSKLNVADDGTKWKRKPELNASSRWFHGPEFLWNTEEKWPSSSPPARTSDEELRPQFLLHFIQTNPVIEMQNFSRWKPLLHRMAYVFRAIDNFRNGVSKQTCSRGPLTQNEMIKAESYLYRVAQNSKFSDEIAILASNNVPDKSKQQIRKSSPLFHLCPYLDSNGLLRVTGRTKACEFIDFHTANPIILPRDHYLTKLVVASIHEEYKHQNHETTMNEIRQRFYISRLKSVYRSMRNDCQRCKIDRASPQPPLMSDLPVARLAAFSRPFTHMGVDYFGPMLVLVGRRTEKRWGVLATCLTTRAIHLEVACSLTTDSCILSIRNIMARRGTPSAIYSDRGTNFQGARKDLKEAMKKLDQDKLTAEFTTPRTQWRFITPASPHMGGAWERLVRTVKQNLMKLKTNRLPTDEVLRNLFIEVENIVNSRPLTAIPLDDDESPVLTPNYFLIGSSNGLRSWVPFDDNPSSLKQNWRLSQEIANAFWKSWLRDYLPELTRRTKWFTETKPLEVNDIVVISDNNLPRNCWPKGRIISTKVAADGQVRQATVQTSTGIYERPAVKLAVIDVRVGSNTSP
ncbi:uncharacterized protein LOC129772981 [Toxorhynchites rutilus septentrionalis]|uniref:uncharacterized protein LOC129772981 n=1 Tax=Toxorhynchites rutilus septentrionalis TaxID=329112 RepID=UPI00247AE81F|nr:uncharacterized protein LOC129772981 [Toxorhynchites rutilus septentrionalis]